MAGNRRLNLRQTLLSGLLSLRRGGMTVCNSVADLLFPPVCPVCGEALVDGEKLLCTGCLLKIPRTGYHLFHPNELTDKLLSLHVKIEKAASFFFYRNENPYGRIIRDAKYNGRPYYNRQLARIYAHELMQTAFLNDIDVIIPTPVHWLKQLRRGYNQCDYIARGISEASGIPVMTNLKAVKGHTTQTHKSGSSRRNSMAGIFSVKDPGQLDGKHILIVDDIITTGSTILACAEAVNSACNGVKISVLSLAATRLNR